MLILQTPNAWQGMWAGPQNSDIYISTVLKLVTKCESAVAQLKAKTFFGETALVDVRDLFHPDTFMTALRYLATR